MPPYQPTAFDALYQSRAQLPSCVTPSSNEVARYWNFRQLSIAYAFRLGLGPDLPRDDERCPGFLRLSVDRILTCRFATHTGILTSYPSSSPSGLPSPSVYTSAQRSKGLLKSLSAVSTSFDVALLRRSRFPCRYQFFLRLKRSVDMYTLPRLRFCA